MKFDLQEFRSINFMSQSCSDKYKQLMEKLWQEGIMACLCGVARTPEFHYALWMQGRKSFKETNDYRRALGLAGLQQKENRIVTHEWTSNHIIRTENQKVNCFDLLIVDEDTKRSEYLIEKPRINSKSIKNIYIQVGSLAEEMGLVWGGRKHNPDLSHFDYVGSL